MIKEIINATLGNNIVLTLEDDVVEDGRWYATDKFDYCEFSLGRTGKTWMVKMAAGVIPFDLFKLGEADPGPIKMSRVHVNLVPMFSDEVGFQKYFVVDCEPASIARWTADNLGLSREEELDLRRKLVHLWHIRLNLPFILSKGEYT